MKPVMKKRKALEPLRLNIQYFSEGEGDGIVRGGYNPDEEIDFSTIETYTQSNAEEGGEGDPEGGETPPGEDIQPSIEPQQTESQSEQPQDTYLDFGGRKVNPNDPDSLKGAHEDFQQSQRYIQQLINENRQMQQQFQQQQQQYQQPPQQTEPEIDPEKLNEQMMEKFYENPSEFFKELREQAVQEARKDYEPMMKERRLNSEIQSLQGKYQDFGDNIPHMQKVIEEMGEAEAEQIGLERVYLIAKGMNSQPVQQPSPEELLQNQDFVNQYVVNNPQIQQAVMQQYMSGKQQNQPPKVMGNTFGGTQPLASQNKPRSISDASKMARKYFNV